MLNTPPPQVGLNYQGNQMFLSCFNIPNCMYVHNISVVDFNVFCFFYIILVYGLIGLCRMNIDIELRLLASTE